MIKDKDLLKYILLVKYKNPEINFDDRHIEAIYNNLDKFNPYFKTEYNPTDNLITTLKENLARSNIFIDP